MTLVKIYLTMPAPKIACARCASLVQPRSRVAGLLLDLLADLLALVLTESARAAVMTRLTTNF